MARGAAKAIHCNGEAVTLGPCLDGQFVKRQGNKLVGAEVAGGAAAWGDISGTLSTQADLQGALDGKEDAGTAASAVSAHEAAGDPHTAYLTAGEADALYEAAGAVAAHAGAADPHPGYLTPAEGNAAYEAAGAVATHAAAADPHTGYQKESEKGAANGYASLGADGKVPSAQLPAAGSGSDPWTYLRLANDFTTTSATAVDVTGLGFAPAANERYEFVGRLMVRTATATVGPRPGVAWPTGLSDGVAFIQQTSSATANVFANGNISAAVLAPVGGLPNTTASWPALIEGQATAGASPSGNIRVQLASETAGTTVTMKAGSFLKYRTVP